ncbi:MAG TPA: hypothetical protein VJT33_01620 [bacterium]|nr:hypothetical protein [bacterium]
MSSSRAIAPPLTDVLYTLAEEGADEETTDLTEDMWAGLMRHGADVARRVEEEIDTGGAGPGHDEVDAEDLSALRNAAGVIVTRDHRHGRVRAATYPDENELLVAWNAIVTELDPGSLEADGTETDGSTEGPSRGPESTEP